MAYIHTDVSPNNILLGVDDATALDEVEKAELENPSPRKVLEDRTIYMSYRMPLTAGAPVLSDFGTACVGELGQKHSVDVMPGEYRAPEVIIWAQWDSKIDLWAIGVMVCKRAPGDRSRAPLTRSAGLGLVRGPPPLSSRQRRSTRRRTAPRGDGLHPRAPA